MATTYATAMTAVRNFLQETETSGGFWTNIEISDNINYSMMELWNHWTNKPNDSNPWFVRHEIDNSTASGRTDLIFDTHITDTNVGECAYVLDVFSDSDTPIARWKVLKTDAGAKKIKFEWGLPNEKVWVDAIHKPRQMTPVGTYTSGSVVNVPHGWGQWVVKRAIIYALQKSGQDTRDLKAETDKMLQTLANTKTEETQFL